MRNCKLIITNILDKLYPDMKREDYYFLENRNESDVRNEIIDALNMEGYIPPIDIDIYIMTSQSGSNVVIKT